MMVIVKTIIIFCILFTLLHGFHAEKSKIASSKKHKANSKKRPSTDSRKRTTIPDEEASAKKPERAHHRDKTKPNVIFIFADDLGFSDVGYNGKQYGSGVKTPNIDRLAAKGVILNNYYVQPICTPTRSQLMTGRYQIHTGLQHSNIPPTRPFCLPLDEVTLPQKLKDAGYATHMVGKWHLGFQRKECLPTNRGFDSFLGMYLGSGDYFTHVKSWEGMAGFDFHRDTKYNQTTGYQYYGEYSTHVFANRTRGVIKAHTSKFGKNDKPLFIYLSFQAPHGPLQVPSQYERPFNNTAVQGDRRTLAGMIYCMDEAIGEVVQELKNTGIYENTVIIFSSDNGGAQEIPASNWPLRGSKGTYWEGGVRAVGFVHSPLLPKSVRRTVSNAFMHVSDWFPTIVKGLAGGSLEGTKPLDGYDMWPSITSGGPSPRTELLHNINPLFRKLDVSGYGSKLFDAGIKACLRVGDWKIVTGNQWSYKKLKTSGISKWTAPPESNSKTIVHQDPEGKHIWLFNISADPYEYHEVSDSNPKIVKKMLRRLKDYADTMATPVWPRIDQNYSPADYGDVWGPWSPSKVVTYEQLQAQKQANKEKELARKRKKKQQIAKAKEAKKKKKEKKEKAKKKSKKDELESENVGHKSKHRLKSQSETVVGVAVNNRNIKKKRRGKRKGRNNSNKKAQRIQIEEVQI